MILYLKKVRNLLKNFVLVQVRHIPKAENFRADTLAKLTTACDAPNPAPDWVSSEGVTLRDWDSLTFYFSQLTPAFICTIYVITKIIYIHKRITTGVVSIDNKNSFYIYIIHTTIVTFIIFHTHILESIYLYYYYFTITKLYI